MLSPKSNEVASGYFNCSGGGMLCQVGMLGQWDASTQGMYMKKLVVSVENFGGNLVQKVISCRKRELKSDNRPF